MPMNATVPPKLSTMIVHAIVLLVGMAGLYFAYGQYLKTRQLIAEGTVTTATVIELIDGQGDDGDLFKPKFQFMDKNHKPVEFVSDISSKPPAYDVGDKVAIIYRPDRPDDARVISYWSLFRWSIILAALSMPFMVIGLGFFVFHLFEGGLGMKG